MPIRLQVQSVQLERGRRGVDMRAVKRLMARSSALEAHLAQRVADGKAFAQSISPDGPPVGSGYKFAWVTETAQFPDGVPLGRLVNTSPLWAVVEKGSTAGRPQGGYSPAHYVFERTLAYWQRTGS
jgi:hypothetical protein